MRGSGYTVFLALRGDKMDSQLFFSLTVTIWLEKPFTNRCIKIQFRDLQQKISEDNINNNVTIEAQEYTQFIL